MADRPLASDGQAGERDARPPLTTRRLLDAIDQPIALLDLDGRFVHANDTALRCLGLTREELASRPLPDLSDDPDRARQLLELWAGSTGRRPGSLTFPMDGTTRVRCDGARLDATTLVVQFRPEDVPDRLAMLTQEIETESLRELRSRLREALAELEDANRRLATRNAELERYASAVAHDLRTPLYIVRGYAELLASGDVAEIDEEGQRLLVEMLTGADRMAAVIDGLLSVARLEVTTPGSASDSQAALQVALGELRGEIESADADLQIGELHPAWAQPTHLVQILTNLIGNSLKFRRPDQAPTIWIESEAQADATAFVVEDDGVGVPPDDRERIFDLFDRGSRRPDPPGTGIGLATCRKIVESYGGEIRCEASDRGGARFVFTIADADAAAPSAGPPSPRT